MAINPIALQTKAADVGNAINAFANVRKIQAANQQQQMNQLAMEDAQRKRSSEEAFKNALMTGDYKTPDGMNRLMGIDPTSALALQKNLLDQETARKSALKSDLELFSKAAGGMPDTAENYSFLYKGAVGDNPALASFLPDPSQYKTGLMEQFAVGAEALFKRATTESANQARLNAAATTAAATKEAARIKAGAPTDDMREYDKAVSGGFKGSFEDWMSKNKPSSSQSSLIQEYKLAQEQGYKGTLVDYKKEFGKDIYQETLDKLAAQRDIQVVSTAEGAKGMLDYIGYKVDEEGNETNEIDDLIKESTGGQYQKMGAEALAKFGATTAGRKAIGRLSTIADNLAFGLLNGKLSAGISNQDVKLIQNLVGDIANQDKTVGERLASWDQFIKTVKALSQKKPIGRMNLDETSRPSKKEPLENIFGG